MRHRLHRGTAVIAALAAASCLPEAAPPWQVDHTILAALPIVVAKRGAWGSPTSRADREVADVMPYDTIRPRPFVIGPDGPVDVDAMRPRYFYCRQADCFGAVSQEGGVRDCEPGETVPPASTCELRGGQVELGAMTELLQVSAIFVIAGAPEGPGTTACVNRLRARAGDGESLQDCVLSIVPIDFGPLWRLLALAALEGLEDAVPLTAITAAVTAAEPNLFPGEPPLRVVTDAGESLAGRGDVVAVAAGAAVVVTAEVDPGDAQPFFYIDSVDQFSRANEVLTIGWLFSQAVDWSQPDQLSVTFTAPREPGPLWVYALLGDGNAITPTWLRFEVEAP